MHRNSTSRVLLLAAAVVLALTAAVPLCARRTSSPAPRKAKVSAAPAVQAADTLSRAERRRFDYFYLEAVRQEQAGHYAAAFDLYNHCLAINPHAAEAYFALASYYATTDKDTLALLTMERAAALAPDNDTYQERVAQYYIGTGNYDKAIAAYENLYTHHRDRSDVLHLLTLLYNQRQNYASLLSTLDRLEQVDGPSDDIALRRMSAYEKQGDSLRASQTLRHLVDIHPSEPSYKVMLGNWLMQHGRLSEAEPLFRSALADDPENEFAQNSLYDYYRASGQDSAAVALRNAILLNPKVAASTKTDLLAQIIAANEKAGADSTVSLALVDSVADAFPHDGDLAVFRVSYMLHLNMPDSVVENTLAQSLAAVPDQKALRVELLQRAWQHGRWAEAVDLSLAGTQYHPEDMTFYYFLALAYNQKDELALALDAIRRGVGVVNGESNREMVSDLYALKGDILYEKDEPEAAFAAYDSCLTYKSDNIYCLNNYAYYLSQCGIDLDRAERMSRQTIKAEPGNSTYLDTYAWILHLQGNNAYARQYIDQAIAADSDTSAVLLEHSGDIYAACGLTDEAVSFWQRALEAGPEDRALLQKKIRQRRYIEPKKHK